MAKATIRSTTAQIAAILPVRPDGTLDYASITDDQLNAVGKIDAAAVAPLKAQRERQRKAAPTTSTTPGVTVNAAGRIVLGVSEVEIDDSTVAQHFRLAPAVFAGLPKEAQEQMRRTLLKSETKRSITMAVSEKGALSVYGLGRFPVTLYKGQWEQLRRVIGTEEFTAALALPGLTEKE